MLTPRVNVIVGKAGTGKSRLLKALLTDSRRLIIIDTCMEHADLAEEVALDDVYRRRGESNFRFSVYPDDPEDFEWVCQFVGSRPAVDLAIDEYSFWYPAAQHQPCPGILTIVRVGRKLHQRLFVTTQSPGAITKQICGQAAMWVLYMDESNDRRYVEGRCGGVIDPLELAPIEQDAEGRVIQAHIARYYEGKRTDWTLHTPTCKLSEKS